ncbi:TIGR01459 family HAD-type hydrolase [Aureimonas psammosilenae]|uniref:TIGR01459 family HAD-type hydrolase n=1 Tax=Aureimonas psammosilenae TaxID=2495496 RepID=UPI001260B571|nr:TIGR01459 family HAD-type hydrolase [Aureimonas psammosilenae]
MMAMHERLRDFDYPAFFVDQYGVLHDGHRPYNGAADSLLRLKQAGRTVVLLSNSGRSGDYNAARVERLGIPRAAYDHFVTSGDVALSLLRTGGIPVAMSGSLRCLTVSSPGDRSFAEAAGLAETLNGGEAGLVLIGGSQGDRTALDEYRRILEPAARRKVPAVCTNPDKVMLTGNGGTAFGAGRIAELYEELGGTVTWVGKPFPAIYAHAAELAGVQPFELVCIGDSVEHDVAGAKRFGASAALVRTGIHADLSEAELESLIEAEGHRPDHILASIAW